MLSKNRAVVFGLAALVIIAGYWAFSGHKKVQQRALIAAIKDTSSRLRETLDVVPNAGSQGSLAKIEANLEAVDANLTTVRRSGSSRDNGFSDGAEIYVLGAREILRQQARSIKVGSRAAASRAALIDHMRRAARRDTAWIHEAMAQKKRVENEYFNYNLALRALSELLFTFPDARKRLARHLDDAVLLELSPTEDARRLAIKEQRRTAEDLDFLRRLAVSN